MSIQEIIEVASKYKAAIAVGLVVGGFFVSVLIGASQAFTGDTAAAEAAALSIPARVRSLEIRFDQKTERDSVRFDKLERIGCEPLDAGQRYKLGCPK